MLGHQLLGERAHRGVAAMSVDDQHPTEPGPAHGGDHIAHNGEQRLDAQRNGAGKGQEIRSKPEGHHREDRDAQGLGCLHRDALGKDGVDAERKLRVLLGRADRQNAAIIASQIASTCIQFMSAIFKPTSPSRAVPRAIARSTGRSSRWIAWGSGT